MKKLRNYTGYRVRLILRLLGLMSAFALPVYSWSWPLSDQAPVTNPSWISTGDLNTARHLHTATLLSDGKVLVVGGRNGTGDTANTLDSAELYDPATGTWSVTGNLNWARSWHTATLLPNGKVLVAGGLDRTSPPHTVTTHRPHSNSLA